MKSDDGAAPAPPAPTHLPSWIASIRATLLPPVGNRLLFGAGQHKAMVVAGPNARADFHVEDGEEFFFQLEGAVELLLVLAPGAAPARVAVRAGEAFVLPARVPHSPQRAAGTLGLVLERERRAGELDALRWYAPDGSVLYEERFACVDLGAQLAPVIARFNASRAAAGGGPPAPGEVGAPPPRAEDEAPAPAFAPPIALRAWAAGARAAGARGAQPLWGPGAPPPRGAAEYAVAGVLGGGAPAWARVAPGELFLLMLEGAGAVHVRAAGDAGAGERVVLAEGDVLNLRGGGALEARLEVGGEAGAAGGEGLCLTIANASVRA